MAYHGPDNIYWLFSSAAQSIAALIGFLAAGYVFANDTLDRQIARDETYEEINAEIKTQYHGRLKWLLALTGISIGSSLVMVFLNGYDLGWWGICFRIIAALLTLVTLWTAISFVTFIIDPNKAKVIVKKLIDENKDIEKEATPGSSTPISFVQKFINLEGLLREYAMLKSVARSDKYQRSATSPLGEIIGELAKLNLIGYNEMQQLRRLSQIRNLAVHGDIRQVSPTLQQIVDNLTDYIRDKVNAEKAIHQ